MRLPSSIAAPKALALAVFTLLGGAIVFSRSFEYNPLERNGTTMILITPTHPRLSRHPHLMQLQSILRHVPNVLWIVVEDAEETDPLVSKLLARVPSMEHVYLAAATNHSATTHRGVEQRNAALDYVQNTGLNGVIYFADDDNAYDTNVFEKLRSLSPETFTVFAVGNLGMAGFEGPVLSQSGQPPNTFKITHWRCDFCKRRWNVDMAGLAMHTSALSAESRFSHDSSHGNIESDLLKTLERNNASLVLFPSLVNQISVWHNYAIRRGRVKWYPEGWAADHIDPATLDLEAGYVEADVSLPLGHLSPLG